MCQDTQILSSLSNSRPGVILRIDTTTPLEEYMGQQSEFIARLSERLARGEHGEDCARDGMYQSCGRGGNVHASGRGGNVRVPSGAYKALENSSNAWKCSVATDEYDAAIKKCRAVLNKLTPEKFERLVPQLFELAHEGDAVLHGLIKMIHAKAVTELTYTEMYARICQVLQENIVSTPAASDLDAEANSSFKRVLAAQCQMEFEKVGPDSADFETPAELEVEMDKYRKRSGGNIKFVGELYKVELLTEKIMHQCIRQLLGNTRCGYTSQVHHNVEALCKLLTTIGHKLDHPKAQSYMSQYFDRMKMMTEKGDNPLPSRLTFMIKDVLDLRRNRWRVKESQKQDGPKTLDQVHRDHALKTQQQGGKGGKGDRGGKGGKPSDPSRDYRVMEVPEDLVQRLIPSMFQKRVRKANKHWVQLQGYKQKSAEGTDLDESQLASYQGLKDKGYLPQVAKLWSQLVEADTNSESDRVEELQHELQSVLAAISPAAVLAVPAGVDDEYTGLQTTPKPRSPPIAHMPVVVGASAQGAGEGGEISSRFRSAKANLAMWSHAEADTSALFGEEIESAVCKMVHEFGKLSEADRPTWLRKYAFASYSEGHEYEVHGDIETLLRSTSEDNQTRDPTELSALAAMYLPEKYAGNQRRQLANERLQYWDLAQLCYFAQNCRWFRENYVPQEMSSWVFEALRVCIFARNNGIPHQNNSNKPDVTAGERQKNIKAFLDALEAIGVNPSSGRYKSIHLLRKGNSPAYMQQWMPLKFSNQLEDLLSNGAEPRKWLVDKVVGTLEMQTLTYRVAVVGGDMGTGKSTLAAKLVHEPRVNCAAHHLCSKKDTAVAFVKSICAQLDTRIMRGNLQGLVDIPEEMGFTDETCSPEMIARTVLKYANDQITRKYTSKGSQTIVVDALNLCPPQMLEVLKLIDKGLSDISNVGLKLVCTTTDVAASKQTLGVDDNSVICIEAHEKDATDDVKKFAVSELSKKESYDGNPAQDAQQVANKVGCNFHHAVLFLEACAKSADLETIPQSIQALYFKHFDSCCSPSSITATKGVVIDAFDETTPPEILKKSFEPMLLYMRQCESQSMVNESPIDRERTISILEVRLHLPSA